MSDEELRKLPSFQADQIKTLYNKTTSLEKKFEDMPSLFKINNEIQEFRNLEQERWSWTDGQIAKIKEDIKDCKLSIGSLNSNLGLWILKWGITQEVLRDIMDILWISDLMSTEFYNKQLKKLDSGKQTEKKEDGIYTRDKIIGSVGDRTLIKRYFFIKKETNFSQPKLIWINKKASGGENTGGVRMVEQLPSGEKSHISHVALRHTVSKLPEPICPFCGRKLIRYKQAWICGHGCTKPALKPTEPENDEPWECPICYKTVYIGYTVHRHCLDKLIEGFLREIVELYFSLGDDKVEKFKFASLKQEYEGMIK